MLQGRPETGALFFCLAHIALRSHGFAMRKRAKRKMSKQQYSALGGKAGTGKAKARTPEQASAAANARWDAYRANRASMEMMATNSAGVSL